MSFASPIVKIWILTLCRPFNDSGLRFQIFDLMSTSERGPHPALSLWWPHLRLNRFVLDTINGHPALY